MATANDSAGNDRHTVGATAWARPLVWLHWLTVLLLVLAAAVILTRDEVAGRQLRFWLLEIHRHLGLAVLALLLLRAALRIRHGRPAASLRQAWPLRAAAWATHVALYGCLLALPILGWLLSDALGNHVHLFGVTLPSLIAPDDDLADRLQAWHQDAAWTLLGLSLLHALAALWHHFVLHDDVLRSMLPRQSR